MHPEMNDVMSMMMMSSESEISYVITHQGRERLRVKEDIPSTICLPNLFNRSELSLRLDESHKPSEELLNVI